MNMTLASQVRLRVLVVEDNPDAAAVLGLMLRLWGHKVTVVRTGSAALEAVRTECPDLALVDILVPDLDGYQLLERLHEEGLGQETIWIAMSGMNEEEHRRHSAEHGFREHLVKPMDPLRLQELLREVAQERAARCSELISG